MFTDFANRINLGRGTVAVTQIKCSCGHDQNNEVRPPHTQSLRQTERQRENDVTAMQRRQGRRSLWDRGGGHVPPIFGLGDIITNVPLNISGVILATNIHAIFS